MENENSPLHSTQPGSIPNVPDVRPQISPSTNSPLPKYLSKKNAIILLILIALLFSFGLFQTFQTLY